MKDPSLSFDSFRKLLKIFLFDKWLLHERICGSCINLRGEMFIIIIIIIHFREDFLFLVDSIFKPWRAILKLIHVLASYIPAHFYKSIFQPTSTNQYSSPLLQINIPARFYKLIFQPTSTNQFSSPLLQILKGNFEINPCFSLQYSSPLLQINIPAHFYKSIFQPASTNQYSNPLLQINIPAHFYKSIFQPTSTNQYSSPLLQINIPALCSVRSKHKRSCYMNCWQSILSDIEKPSYHILVVFQILIAEY